jgi:hypothetical protein
MNAYLGSMKCYDFPLAKTMKGAFAFGGDLPTQAGQELDHRIMRNRVALNASLFYQGMWNYDPARRQALLDFQRRVSGNHALVRSLFGLAHRWVDRRLRDDVDRHFTGAAEGAQVP